MTDLLGRSVECAHIERLLSGTRSGKSGVILVRGEAGIGKTALLAYANSAAVHAGFRVECAVGAESETQFAYAGLHQLCGPLLGHADALPQPQRSAIGVAFGTQAGTAPDPFLVGLATLNLLAEAAEEGPLLCLVDDSQWIDQASAQVLGFVARRLAAEKVALVVAQRDDKQGDSGPFSGLPELRLDGLSDADARTLLAAELLTPLDLRIRDRIIFEANGNPMALIELPRSLQWVQMAGGFEMHEVVSVPRRIEVSFQRRSADLPPPTQELLLVAAADTTADATLLWRAATHLGIPREAMTPAESAGFVEIGTWVRFRHPLARSAVYHGATSTERRRAHGALALATDARSDPDRRAWHRALATPGADEEIAAELEQSADRARARGGLAAAAAFLEHAATLTPEPARRATRALVAAHAKHEVGASEAAIELLGMAASGHLDPLQRARVDLLSARIEFRLTRGSEAPRTLLGAAQKLGPLDAGLAREAYLQAFEAAFHAGRLAEGGGLQEIAEAARDAPPCPGPPRPVDLLLDGLAIRFTESFEESVPVLRRGLEALTENDAAADRDDGRWAWLAVHVAVMLWDDEFFYSLASRAVQSARDAGALATLSAALNAMAALRVFSGELSRAAELFAEEDEIARAIGVPPLPHARFVLAAWRGREPEALELYTAVVAEASRRGEGATLSSSYVSLAYLYNGLGKYEEALTVAAQACEYDELSFSSVALPELVEAAVRTGESERAAASAELLTARAQSSGTPWALGIAARSRALVSTGPEAERLYLEAIEQLGKTRMATHLARAHLVYGEWLRREGRRQDARTQLRTAQESLAAMGAEAYAARAARELRATGEHPRKRTAHPADELTAQELQIARIVATGATSREVGAQLFLSPRTIEAHLRNIFRKLGITSRRQLKDLQLPR